MEITSEEIIRLSSLMEKGLAKTAIIGEILPNGIDERVLKVTRPSFCQFTGVAGPACEYSISFFDLRNVWAQCDKNIKALGDQQKVFEQTIEAVKGILAANESAAPQEEASAALKKPKPKA